MKAAVYHGPHDVRIEQVPEPAAPAAGELVLDVLRASICGTDSSEWAHGPLLVPLRQPHPATGRSGPVVLGHEFVGRIAAAGEGVTGLAVGERVVCGAGVSCGLCDWCRRGRTNLCARYYTIGLHVDGGLAERVAAPASICRRVPDTVDDDAATLAQPLAVALHAVGRSGAAAGDTVAVIGVGGIGAFVVAAVCARPVARVIAVDIDDARLETARALGAHATVDAAGRDLASAILAATDGEGAHVVIEASGAPVAPAAALAAARRGGRVVLVGLQAAPRELDLFAFTVREVDVVTTLAHVCDTDLPAALDLLVARDLAPTVVGARIPLDALVEEGLRPLAEHTACGKILVDPAA
jgi:threonine dehydrogenase-like Zn-dependent dehydrogenase